MTLYEHLTRELIFEKNVKVKLAACELLSNLSLSPFIKDMASDLDSNQISGFIVDCRNLVNVVRAFFDGGEDEKDQSIRDHVFRAVLGFFANLVSYSSIREFLKDD